MSVSKNRKNIRGFSSIFGHSFLSQQFSHMVWKFGEVFTSAIVNSLVFAESPKFMSFCKCVLQAQEWLLDLVYGVFQLLKRISLNCPLRKSMWFLLIWYRNICFAYMKDTATQNRLLPSCKTDHLTSVPQIMLWIFLRLWKHATSIYMSIISYSKSKISRCVLQLGVL